MSKENRVSDELEHGQYWVRFGVGHDWEVMRWDGDCFWGSAGDGYKRESFEVGPQVFPPNSLRSKPVAGVEVKPLEWSKLYTDGNDYSATDARCMVGLYSAFQLSGDTAWVLEFGNVRLGDFDSLDQAQAAALSDYRQRILSTLSLPAKEPDHVYDPNDWEYTLPWEDREQLIEEWQPNEVHKVSTLVDGPDKWIIWLETNGDYDVHWFDSEAEANSALTAALKEA